MPHAQRRPAPRIVGLQPARAEVVILTGACIVRTVLSKLGREALGREALAVSDRGLRHGVRAARFE